MIPLDFIKSRLPVIAMVIAVVGFLATSFTVTGFHDPGYPVLDEVTFTEPTWVAWRIFVPEGELYTIETYYTREDTRMANIGSWRILDGEVLGGGGSGSYYTHGEDLHVQFPDPLGSVLSESSGGGQWAGLGMASQPAARATDHEVVLIRFAGADGGIFEGYHRLYATSGVEILGKTQGPGHILLDQDFAGASVVANQELLGNNYAKAIIDGGFSFDVEHRLFGVFWGFSNSGMLDMSYDGPEGSREGDWWYNIRGEPAGAYEFQVDQVDYWDTAGRCQLVWGTCSNFPVVSMFIADVEVP